MQHCSRPAILSLEDINYLLNNMKGKPFMRYFRKYCTRPKLVPEINAGVLESLEKGEYKPKKHIGVIKSGCGTLPQSLVDKIRTVVIDHPLKKLTADGIKLNQYLYSRHLPLEDEERERKMEEAALWVENKFDAVNLPEEERQVFRKKYNKNIKSHFQKITYSWKPIEFNEYMSKVYLVGRSTANYAIVHRVFQEMGQRLPDFKPKTLFDFGSGVGTVSWVVNHIWQNSLEECFCVDSSGFMNDLALLILKDPDRSESPPKGYSYRQFLPASHTLKYDLVVSAFSLFELPTLKSRLETILNLWKKTQGYLVIIEQGTNAGFQVVNEARDFILEFCQNSESSLEHKAHVFAPCSHDQQCPRFYGDKTPCNFEVLCRNPFYPSLGPSKERFSFVVLKKGSRPQEDPQWPRIVRPVLPRSKHVVCRLCTSAGKLEEIVFTASKHGKATYKCARASYWGDLLPITVKEVRSTTSSEDGKESSNEEARN